MTPRTPRRHSDTELHTFYEPGASADAGLSLEMDHATAERIDNDAHRVAAIDRR